MYFMYQSSDKIDFYKESNCIWLWQVLSEDGGWFTNNNECLHFSLKNFYRNISFFLIFLHSYVFEFLFLFLNNVKISLVDPMNNAVINLTVNSGKTG